MGPAWITMLPGEGDRVLFEPTRTEAELHFRPEPVLYNLTKVPWFPNERLDSSPAERMEILDQCRATHPRERAEDEARRALSAP
ncbi:MAG: hypothetical protein IT285_09610 [Bdellovibrionales bacterium]|nr:hypothetical protein [Bdellovibrionales bacterium]